MSNPARLLAAGIPQEAANMLGQFTGSALTATGTTIANAFPLITQNAYFTTVASGAGCGLPAADAQPPHNIYNGGANALSVYPTSAQVINGGAAGDPFVIEVGEAATFLPTDNVGWIAVSASSGTLSPSFDTVTANAIVGGDASLGIAGIAAAQGGAVAIVGGVSSTTGNTGGAVSITGAAGTGTGAGGAVTFTGGASGAGATGDGGAATLLGGASASTNGAGGDANVAAGAGRGTGAGGAVVILGAASGGGATGNGGAVTLTGGAAASVNGTGGAITITAGAGSGTGTGGALTLVTGAAGSTGVAGALSLAVGAATAGNGSGITIFGGAGAGGTASGGNVNIKGGAAVSTGAPGEVQVNGDSNLFFATYMYSGTAAAAVDQVFFIATRACRVKTMSEIHSVAAGGTSTLTVIKDSTTNAPGAGTSLHQSGSFNLNGTANTVQVGVVSTTIATANLAAGDRLSVKFANAIQASVGIVVTVGMVPI